MDSWNEFGMKRIVEVRQRIQTVVIYEELKEDVNGGFSDMPERKEAIVDSFDRPLQASYT